MCRFVALMLMASCFLTARAGEFAMSAAEKKILELTNEERKKEELPPLKPAPLLFKVAKAHSENMAKQGKMEHDLDDKTPFQRLKEAGYKYMRASENIAAGDPEIALEQLMKAWMDSEGHRKNILCAECTEIGLGLAKDKEGKVYYTQLFAQPRSP